MEKCNYCGATSTCKGAYPEGCFFQNKVSEDRIKLSPDDFKEKYKDNDIKSKGMSVAHGVGNTNEYKGGIMGFLKKVFG